MASQPLGLILDLDDTIYDASGAYSRALTEIGIDPNGSDYLGARAEVKRRLGQGHVSAHNRLLYFQQLLRNQERFTARAALELMERYETALARDVRAQWEKLGREALFARLSARYRVVLLTNENTRTQLIKLRALDPEARFFRAVITSEECGVEKPEPPTIRAAIEAIRLPAQQCWAVGDHFKTDLEPALDEGCSRAILTTEFSGGDPAAPEKKITRIARLGELEALLEC